MAGAKSEEQRDPLGKRALYGAPSATANTEAPLVLPVGKRALYSATQRRMDGKDGAAGAGAAGRGSFTVRCQRCGQTSHVGLLHLLIFQIPGRGVVAAGQVRSPHDLSLVPQTLVVQRHTRPSPANCRPSIGALP